MTPGQVVLFAVVLLALLAGWWLVRWLVRRFKATQATFDIVVAPEVDRGGLDGCISRHPAGKQRRAGDQ